MRFRTALGSIVVVAALLAVGIWVVTADDDNSDQSLTSPPDASPSAIPISTDGAQDSVPRLSSEDIQAAKDIVAADSLIAQYFPDHTILGVSAWTIDGQVVGAGVAAALPKPTDIDMTLPYAYIGEIGQEGERLGTPLPAPHYKVRYTDIKMGGVQGLAMSVDLNAGKVVEIVPLPFAP